MVISAIRSTLSGQNRGPYIRNPVYIIWNSKQEIRGYPWNIATLHHLISRDFGFKTVYLRTARFRLYYLYQGPSMSLIREHTVINFLFWSFPALSAILATTHVAENLILHSEEPLLFLFRVVQQDFTLETEPSWMMFLISLSVSFTPFRIQCGAGGLSNGLG